MTCRSLTFISHRFFVIIPGIVAQLWLLAALCGTCIAGTENFPEFDEIKANVRFWEKIYAHYSITDAVIHDSEDVSKIYEVLPLLDDGVPGAARLNESARKLGVEKYRNVLQRLAKFPPKTVEEKRIAAMFTGKAPLQQMARAAENVRCQTGLKERFIAGVLNSASYMREIKKIFRAHRLPEELVYLTHVESSFNTKAYSKYGAAGIWQFTRATGKQYLTIDYIVDERLDPIAASYAAAKYLQKSHRTLHDWPLAITSYNYGLSGAKRAQADHGTYQEIFKYYSKGHFKFASRNFYSEFLAALKVATRLEKGKGFQLTQGTPYQYFRLPDYAPLPRLAHHLQISPELILELNPALRPPVAKGEKHIPRGYNLRLPGGKAIDTRLASVPKSLFIDQQKRSLYHRVQNGETASGIAKKYGVSLKDLRTANNLDSLATIYVRQKLRIPNRSISPPMPTVIQGKEKKHNQPVLLAYKKVHPSGQGVDYLPQKDPSIYNVFNRTTRGGKTYGTIKVQPEESIELYSQWLGEPVQQLYQLNNITQGSPISPGQRLTIIFNKISANQFEDLRLDFLQDTEDDFFSAYTVIGQQTYRVNHGDTLWDLCYNKFDIPLWLLERYNSSTNLINLRVSQELIIPIIQSI